jgi:hypothetical protein
LIPEKIEKWYQRSSLEGNGARGKGKRGLAVIIRREWCPWKRKKGIGGHH